MPSHYSPPRLIIVDDNIRTVGGHFFEQAALLGVAATRLGFQTHVATNTDLDRPRAFPASVTVHPTFRSRRMFRWSLGIDGGSRLGRDSNGNPIGAWTERVRQFVSDRLVATDKRPGVMLDRWAQDFADLIGNLNLRRNDRVVVATGDDFALLALAEGLRRLRGRSTSKVAFSIDVILHFALVDGTDRAAKTMLGRVGHQMKAAITAMAPHRVKLHATTEALAAQCRRADLRIDAIPYPTRVPNDRRSAGLSGPIRCVLPGLPRAEKGEHALKEFIGSIADPWLRDDGFQLSLQMPADGWQAMVPASLHRKYRDCLAAGEETGARGSSHRGRFDIRVSNLSTTQYHRWLDTASLGLFLYEPERYRARCSGVLLEFLVRGVPVIVPDRCWLADQVRAAGGHRSIGLIYQSRQEIPELMDQFRIDRSAMTARAADHAVRIRKRHSAINTLAAMGIEAVGANRDAA